MCLFLSQSLEDFGDEDDEDVDDRGYEEDIEDDQDYLEDKDDRKNLEKKESGIQSTLSKTDTILETGSNCPA